MALNNKKETCVGFLEIEETSNTDMSQKCYSNQMAENVKDKTSILKL